MSGLVALFDRAGDGVDGGRLEAMLDGIAHRGPDGGGSWIDDRVALGHQQLATTPEARFDDQPCRDAGLVVVADARLDNRDALVRALPVGGDDRPLPDSRLLLSAYREWGERCVDHLIGAFAFVVWDADAGDVFCARDRFGVKPLYYHLTDETLAVASEAKALLTLPAVRGTVDEVRVGEFLAGVFDDKERSFYREIRRLPPAHTTTVRESAVDRRQYWDLDPTRTIELGSDAAYERRFRELFEQAVGCRLRTAGGPGGVGASLSGGLDSSSIALVARDRLPEGTPLPTFSNVYDEAPSADEREYIETVTEREGIDPHYVFMDEVGSFADRDRMMRHYDLPPHDSMHHAIWERLRRADDAGVDVLLEGALGDSAVGYGLGLLSELLRTGRWRRLREELRELGEVAGAPPRHLFVRHAVTPLVPARAKRGYARVRGRSVLAAGRNSTLDPAFVDRIDLDRRIRESDAGSPLRETARRRQRRSLLAGLMTASLETVDLAAAAFGVEPRYPFADKRLVEFSLAVPATQQLSGGWTRSIVRRSLDDLLPERIRTRPWKTDMNEGFWNSLSREDDRLRRLVDDPGPLAAYLDPAALRTAYDGFAEGANVWDARALWRALSLSEWLLAYDPTTAAEERDARRARRGGVSTD